MIVEWARRVYGRKVRSEGSTVESELRTFKKNEVGTTSCRFFPGERAESSG